MRGLRLLAVSIVFLLSCAFPSKADSIYKVSGTFTLLGTDACGGAPCVESLAFSFDVTWVPVIGATGQFGPEILPGAQFASSGPLGSFDISTIAPFGYFALCDHTGSTPCGDEIDFDVGNLLVPVPQPLQLADGYLYACQTATCVTDFAGYPFSGTSAYGIFLYGTLQYREAAVPEASTLCLLLIGVLPILLMLTLRTRRGGWE